MVFLFNEPVTRKAEDLPTVLLAHGAGAPMDSNSMSAIASALATAGLHVVRFEFDYMAQRRQGGRRPPPKAARLMPEYIETVEQLGKGPLIIGGKSMGGRVASMVADELHARGLICGLLCLGYPFHPPGKPDQLRIAHLETLVTPTLIVQGTRDVFGTFDEVSALTLSPSIQYHWLEDGDHDLRPRKTVSGFSAQDHLHSMAAKTLSFAERLAR